MSDQPTQAGLLELREFSQAVYSSEDTSDLEVTLAATGNRRWLHTYRAVGFGFERSEVLETGPEGVHWISWGDCIWPEPLLVIPNEHLAGYEQTGSCVYRGLPVARHQRVETITINEHEIAFRMHVTERTRYDDGDQTVESIEDYLFDRELGWFRSWRKQYQTTNYDSDGKPLAPKQSTESHTRS